MNKLIPIISIFLSLTVISILVIYTQFESEQQVNPNNIIVEYDGNEPGWLEPKITWDKKIYSSDSFAVIQVIDTSMNLNPEAIDSFDVNVWSDSSTVGINLRVTETNEATGIFEGTMFFTTTDESFGGLLFASEGDTIYVQYKEKTDFEKFGKYQWDGTKQNDLWCSTEWYMENTTIDEENLISSIRETIFGFGPEFDLAAREIKVYHHDEETVISIGGSWLDDQNQHEELTSIVKNHIGDSKIIRDDIVSCQ